MKKIVVTTRDTDLGSLLMSLASQLRNHGMTVTGMVAERYAHSDQEYKDANELAASLDQIAMLLQTAGRSLCPKCSLIEVVEQTIFAGKHR